MNTDLRPVQGADHHDANHRRRNSDLAACPGGTAEIFAMNENLRKKQLCPLSRLQCAPLLESADASAIRRATVDLD